MKGCGTLIGAAIGVCIVVAIGFGLIALSSSGRNGAAPARSERVSDRIAEHKSETAQSTTAEPENKIPEPDIPEEYIYYAAAYRAEGASELDLPRADEYSLGSVGSRFRVNQIDGSTILTDKIGRYGIGDYGVLIRNVKTTQLVSGTEVSYPDALFWYEGTVSYTTVLGSTRTVYAITAINKERLKQAVQYLDDLEAQRAAKEAEDRDRRLAEAQSEFQRTLDALGEFDREHQFIKEYLSLQQQRAMYEQVSDRPEIAAKINELELRISEIGVPTEPEIKEYETGRAEYKEQVEQARDALLIVRREE